MFHNYYISSFFWSTLQRVLNAIIGFVTVPVLLGLYGKADYGILAIATACNGYMHLLDLGINIGAIKFYAQWRKEGRVELIYRVARTNITFYLAVSCVNIVGLLFLALWGKSFFSVTQEQFLQLRWCLLILCLFSPFSWVTTVFSQLLISDKKLDFTMQVQCVQTFLKGVLIVVVVLGHISLSVYFFFLTLLLSLLLIPYAYKCKKENLIDCFVPAAYWEDFRIVFFFSLSVFALSLFQVTASQSCPIVLSIFSRNGAEVVAEYRVLEVIPSLIIMICGQFAAIFLPQASSLVSAQDKVGIENFAKKWTVLTSVISNLLCFPFIICASEILSAYVGKEYETLSIWLVIWCVTVLSYIHTTPANSLMLAYGKTRIMVIVTAMSCILSIIINIFLCDFLGVGSAIIGYFIHVIISTSLYYIYYYNKLMGLSRIKMLLCFVKPTFYASIIAILIGYIPFSPEWFPGINERLCYILLCGIKSLCWVIPYFLLLFYSRILNLKEFIYVFKQSANNN